jgi:hypothetical protein
MGGMGMNTSMGGNVISTMLSPNSSRMTGTNPQQSMTGGRDPFAGLAFK